MIFDNHREVYNEAIHNSWYKNELEYSETKEHNNNRDNNLENYRTKNNININTVIRKNIDKKTMI